MNLPPPPAAPLLAPSNDVGNAMHRLYDYVLNGMVQPNDADLAFFPQVRQQLENPINHLNNQQRYRLNNLMNRYQMMGNNMALGFGRRKSPKKSSKKSRKSKKSPSKTAKKLRTVMKSIERRLKKIRSKSKKSRSKKSKSRSRK